MKVKRIVVSKQADIHSGIMDFWYFWYTRIFRADEVIVTPVETPICSTRDTIDFFSGRPRVKIVPIRMEFWNAILVWQKQLSAIRDLHVFDRHKDENHEVLVVSADADMFYENVEELPPNSSSCFFNEVNMSMDSWPDAGRIREQEIIANRGKARVGFVNSIHSGEVGVCGHSIDGTVAPSPHYCYHIPFTGVDNHLEKIKSVEIDRRLKPNISGHWRAAQRFLRENGEKKYRIQYEQHMRRLRSVHVEELSNRFRDVLESCNQD